MIYHVKEEEKSVSFWIDITPNVLLDELYFVILVRKKFDGTESYVGRFHRIPVEECAGITIQFPDDQWTNARDFFQKTLAGQMIRRDYIGALDHSDPGRKEAQKFLLRIRDSRLLEDGS